MALRDDLKNVKNSASSEEQFLESIIKSEIFVKKYKKPLIAIFVILVIGALSYSANNYVKQKKFYDANEAYNELIVNPNNEEAKKTLSSKDKNLFALFEFRQALDNKNMDKIKELSQQNDLDPIFKDVINFTLGQNSGEILESYSSLIKGYDFLKEGKIEEANSEFIKIPPDSELAKIVKNLRHYNGMKK